MDDLLKLAKQFDLNMFRQDEEEVEDMHHQSLELLSEDILDFENIDPNNICGAAAGTDVRVNQHVEDDLDFLFDGPTQHVSENLSQVSSAQPSQFKPSTTLTSGELPSHGPTSMASTTSPKDTSHNDEFEDDWENDDLLNDSLVFEITQNPQNFVAPKHSSTQKPGSEMKYQTPAKVPVRGGVSLHQSDVSKVEKENRRQRTTFKLESNPNLSETDKWTNLKVDSSSDKDKATQQTRFSSSKCFSVEPGSQHTWQTCQLNSGPQTSQFYQRTSAASTMSASNTAVTQTTPKEPQVMSSNSTAPAVCDFLDQDLDSFFSSDLVWDDLADDDLLCEMCEDVENQIQSADNVSIKQTLPDVQVSKQRAALQPSNRTWANRTQRAVMQPSFPCASDGPAGSSLADGSTSNVTAGVQVNKLKDSYRYTPPQTASGFTSSSTCVQGGSRVQLAAAAPHPASKDLFTFKKPNKPVSAVTNKGKDTNTQVVTTPSSSGTSRYYLLFNLHLFTKTRETSFILADTDSSRFIAFVKKNKYFLKLSKFHFEALIKVTFGS